MHCFRAQITSRPWRLAFSCSHSTQNTLVPSFSPLLPKLLPLLYWFIFHFLRRFPASVEAPLFQSSLCFLDFTCFFPLTTFSFTWTAVKTKQGRGEHFLLSQLHSALLINSSSQNYTLSYSYFSVHWTPWHLCFNKAGAQRFSTSLVSNSVQKQIIKIIFCWHNVGRKWSGTVRGQLVPENDQKKGQGELVQSVCWRNPLKT